MLLLLPPKFPSQTRLPFPSTPKLKVVSETDVFPSFLPKEVHRIKDPFARNLAKRIQRLPVAVRFLENPIMSSCVKPMMQNKENPIVLLHGFDRCSKQNGDIHIHCLRKLVMRHGLFIPFFHFNHGVFSFSSYPSEKLPSCDVVSKRDHFYQFWKSHIKKAMILVGPSLGSAVVIDFAVNYPEAVEKLVLIDASVYAEGTGNLATLPRAAAYAGAYLLKSIPLRLYANILCFTNLPFSTSLDWTNVGRLHCLLSWWEDATVDFMTSGGYNVVSQIKKIKQKTLIIWGENDRIISNKLGVRLHCELADAIIRQIPDCGHLPHVERPDSVFKLIVEFVRSKSTTENECVSPL